MRLDVRARAGRTHVHASRARTLVKFVDSGGRAPDVDARRMAAPGIRRFGNVDVRIRVAQTDVVAFARGFRSSPVLVGQSMSQCRRLRSLMRPCLLVLLDLAPDRQQIQAGALEIELELLKAHAGFGDIDVLRQASLAHLVKPRDLVPRALDLC